MTDVLSMEEALWMLENRKSVTRGGTVMTYADLLRQIASLRETVRLADALYVSAYEQAQTRSDREYAHEFGTKGPSLAGFLTGGADRDYHYARHTAGECPAPHHKQYMRQP